MTFSENITSESSFSETQKVGVSISIGTSFKVKIPIIATGQINTQITSSSEWSYARGEKETRSRVTTVADVLQVPARSSLRAQLVCMEYETDITYIAILRGKTTRRTIKLTGKWEGVLQQEENVRYFYPDGKMIAEDELSNYLITSSLN